MFDEPILVAGAGGFIGGHLVRYLLACGASRIRAVDRKPLSDWFQCFDRVDSRVLDLSRREACAEAVSGMGIVYNLAADMGGMGFIATRKLACSMSIIPDVLLLEAAAGHGVKRFFYASSACVYDIGKQTRPDVTALKEADAYPAQPEDGYGWEKLHVERICRHFTEEAGLPTRIARLHNVYGPLGTYDGGREKAPAALCRKIAEAKIEGRRAIEIWGDGEQTRSFTYIDDCLDGIARITASDTLDQPLNLGSDELVSINDVVGMLEEIAGVRLARHHTMDAPTGVRGRNSDNTLIRSVLGWAPSTALQSGLERTFRWVYDEMRSGRPADRFRKP